MLSLDCSENSWEDFGGFFAIGRPYRSPKLGSAPGSGNRGALGNLLALFRSLCNKRQLSRKNKFDKLSGMFPGFWGPKHTCFLRSVPGTASKVGALSGGLLHSIAYPCLTALAVLLSIDLCTVLDALTSENHNPMPTADPASLRTI